VTQDRQNVKRLVIVTAKGTAAVGALVCVLASLAPSARAQTPSVEEQLLALVNGPRSHTIVMHNGLRAAARAHSAAMASAGALSHQGAHGRVYNAAADPPEKYGGSDDGFTGTWCEVVSWQDVKTDENVARRFYDDWVKSTEDSSCMSNRGVTAAGIGAYERAGRWWVTLEMVEDKTPPLEGAVPAAPSAAPVASGTPRATSPSAVPSSESHESGSSNVAAPRAVPAKSSGLTWQMVAVAAVGFSVVPLLGALRRRRTPKQ
jgi:hypothetical protein